MSHHANFDYYTVLGPIHFGQDPRAVQMYKASAGSLADTMRRAGCTEEQIENGLRTHFESVAALLAGHLRSHVAQQDYSDTFRAVASPLIDKIDPVENPCGRTHCPTCHPEVNR